MSIVMRFYCTLLGMAVAVLLTQKMSKAGKQISPPHTLSRIAICASQIGNVEIGFAEPV